MGEMHQALPPAPTPAIKMMQVGSSIPQNVNFAIQASIVTNFLSIKGISPKVTAAADKPLAPSDVAEVAKDFTVQIYCQGVERISSRSPDNPELSVSNFVNTSTGLAGVAHPIAFGEVISGTTEFELQRLTDDQWRQFNTR